MGSVAAGQRRADATELGGGTAERELVLLGRDEVAVQRVVQVDTLGREGGRTALESYTEVKTVLLPFTDEMM